MFCRIRTVLRLAVASAAALVVAGCDSRPVNQFPLDPFSAMVVSEPRNLMAHCPSTEITPDGTVYIAYYRDTTQPIESMRNTTIEVVMDRFSLKNPDKVERFSMMSSGQSVGDYKQEAIPPYDPRIFVDGEELICDFLGYVDVSPTVCRRVFDLRTGTFRDKIEPCSISYIVGGERKTVPVSQRGLTELYVDMGFGTPSKSFFWPVMSQRFVPGEDGFRYTVLTCWWCPESRPVVVRTNDGLNYDVAFVCPEFIHGSAEASIVFHDDACFILSRSTFLSDNPAAGTYMGKYSLTGDCLVKPYKLGDVESRMDLAVHEGKVFAFCNAAPNLPDQTGIWDRRRLRISEIDSSARTVRSWDVVSPYSIQYYCANDHGGKLYFTFVEDRFGRNPEQSRADIAFRELNL